MAIGTAITTDRLFQADRRLFGQNGFVGQSPGLCVVIRIGNEQSRCLAHCRRGKLNPYPPRGEPKMRKLGYPIFELFVAAILFAGLILAFFSVTGHDAIKETTKRGNIIVDALERYHSDHGKYPDVLAALIPEYEPNIPLPTWGLGEWIYDPTDSGFDLRVNESKNTGDGNSRWLKYLGPKLGWETGQLAIKQSHAPPLHHPRLALAHGPCGVRHSTSVAQHEAATVN